jgi:hypothetical protein
MEEASSACWSDGKPSGSLALEAEPDNGNTRARCPTARPAVKRREDEIWRADGEVRFQTKHNDLTCIHFNEETHYLEISQVRATQFPLQISIRKVASIEYHACNCGD